MENLNENFKMPKKKEKHGGDTRLWKNLITTHGLIGLIV